MLLVRPLAATMGRKVVSSIDKESTPSEHFDNAISERTVDQSERMGQQAYRAPKLHYWRSFSVVCWALPGSPLSA